MQRIIQILITFFIISQFTSCSSVPNKDWFALIPENSTFVIVPEQGLNVQDIVTKEYASYLDDLTPTAIQQSAGLDVDVSNRLQVKALVLNPTTSTTSHILWIAESPAEKLGKWASRFYQPFTQNNYEFNGLTIHKLFFNKGEIFAAQVRDYLIISESSLLIENSIRSYLGQAPSIQLEENPDSSTLVVNTPELDQWIEQFSLVSNRPSIMDKFTGTKPVSLKLSTTADTTNNVQLSGQIQLQDNNHSVLVDAFSYENKPISLDQHIAGNAASFAILRLPPLSIPNEPDDTIISPLDSLLLNDIETYQKLANTMSSEFAFEAFPESGLMATGEFLFMRKLQNVNALRQQLIELYQDGYINRQDNTYRINSRIMGELIGSELSTLRDFSLAFSNDVVVIAKRKGLAESVNADRIRRRVIYYDDTYSDVRDNLPSEVSGFVWTNSNEFLRFIAPKLKPENIAGGLLSRFDVTSMVMTKTNNAIDFSLNTYSKEGSSMPYEELWVMPLSNFELSGEPVLGNLVGSSATEITFSTQDGRVYSLAIDGTIAMQASTNGLTAVGGPQLYDWYGNNQQIVFLAAGSKIFAWNENGNLLPRFPIEMGEQITSPVFVQDILRNGVPEIVVATEDRKVHVLDGRGENVRGWPRNTNTIVRTQPVFEIVNGTWSIWAFSENTLHSWLRNGNARPGYPQFVNARFTGSPVIYEDQVIASAADGYLYSIGMNPVFEDSIATAISEDSVAINTLYVANSELTSVKVEEGVLLKDSTDFYREDIFLTQSANGSVFLYNDKGDLRFTKSLGQPSSSTFTPQLADINSDLNMELLALAEFGRLFAWEILTDKRLFGIPTSGMKYPIITDLNGDGRKELIAQTREGLRCWTINKVD
ncbi:MAG TPA: hypothetical protein VFM80_07130 [Gracilimonas sp.]|uniref:hypothetical protein n=1 Tax=Gracilimonas sp. TaxID=1974203 RepID=UPI002D8143BF|nr:hypothetical protein [Gracilimonas sp.]